MTISASFTNQYYQHRPAHVYYIDYQLINLSTKYVPSTKPCSLPNEYTTNILITDNSASSAINSRLSSLSFMLASTLQLADKGLLDLWLNSWCVGQALLCATRCPASLQTMFVETKATCVNDSLVQWRLLPAHLEHCESSSYHVTAKV